MIGVQAYVIRHCGGKLRQCLLTSRPEGVPAALVAHIRNQCSTRVCAYDLLPLSWEQQQRIIRLLIPDTGELSAGHFLDQLLKYMRARNEMDVIAGQLEPGELDLLCGDEYADFDHTRSKRIVQTVARSGTTAVTTPRPVASRDELLAAAQDVEPAILETVSCIASSIGLGVVGSLDELAAQPGAAGLLVGPLKTANRVDVKLANYANLVADTGIPAAAWIFDAVRYSFACRTVGQIIAVLAGLNADAEVMKVVRMKNLVKTLDDTHFRRLQAVVKFTAGNGQVHLFEVQIHLASIFSFRNANLRICRGPYEYFRRLFQGGVLKTALGGNTGWMALDATLAKWSDFLQTPVLLGLFVLVLSGVDFSTGDGQAQLPEDKQGLYQASVRLMVSKAVVKMASQPHGLTGVPTGAPGTSILETLLRRTLERVAFANQSHTGGLRRVFSDTDVRAALMDEPDGRQLRLFEWLVGEGSDPEDTSGVPTLKVLERGVAGGGGVKLQSAHLSFQEHLCAVYMEQHSEHVHAAMGGPGRVVDFVLLHPNVAVMLAPSFLDAAVAGVIAAAQAKGGLSREDEQLLVKVLGSPHPPRCLDLTALTGPLRLRPHEAKTLSQAAVGRPTKVIVNLSRSGEELRDVSALGSVHTLNLSHCNSVEEVSALGTVHTLTLGGCSKLADVSGLGTVHTLSLSKCSCVTDVSALGTICNLNLSESQSITDVSALGKVHTLNLSKCDAVADVSALVAVHNLNLSSCRQVTNVSALLNVHTLNLSACDGVSNVSVLGTGEVHSLDLSKCNYVTDVSALGTVCKLNLSECRRVADVSALGKVHTLDLSHCKQVVDVSALGNVHTLRLYNCSGVTDVSALGSVHTLDLHDCDSVVDVSALGSVHMLNLMRCDNVVDVSALGNVHMLDLSFCDNVDNVAALGTVHTLKLHCCQKVVDVSALGTVYSLDLSGCGNVHDVSSLGTVHTLDLHECENLANVSALGTVHTLSLHGCEKVVDVSALLSVHSLKMASGLEQQMATLRKRAERHTAIRKAKAAFGAGRSDALNPFFVVGTDTKQSSCEGCAEWVEMCGPFERSHHSTDFRFEHHAEHSGVRLADFDILTDETVDAAFRKSLLREFLLRNFPHSSRIGDPDATASRDGAHADADRAEEGGVSLDTQRPVVAGSFALFEWLKQSESCEPSWQPNDIDLWLPNRYNPKIMVSGSCWFISSRVSRPA